MLRIVLALTALLTSSAALAQFACLSNATGNWNAAGTWTSCGGGVPGFDDTANIRNGHTVSITSTPITVLDVTVSNGTLQFAGAAKVLNINGNLSIAATEVFNVNGGSNSTHTVNITGNIANAGNLTCGTGNDLCNFVFNGGGTQTLSGAGTTQFNNITIAAGTTVNSTDNITVVGTTAVNGTLGITATTGTKTFTGAVTIAGTGTWNNSANEDVAMGGSLTNNGTFTSGTGTYTFQTTAAQSWAGTAGLTFDGNVVVSATRTNNTATQINGNLSGASALTNAAGQTLRVGGNANGLTTLTATAANNTVEYNGAGVQTPKLTNYANLTVSSAGAVAFNGSFSIAGDLTDNGNFSHTGAANIVTFNGTAAQNLLGTAANTTFQNVVMANTAAAATRGLTIAHDMTVVTNLTFSAAGGAGGRIVTGASKVVIEATAGTITNACPTDTNDFIAGNLQRFIPAGGPTTVDFPVGTDATAACSPVTLVFSGVAAGGGRLIVGATAGDHPQIASSGLDSANSVNRYWTLTTTGVTGTPLPAFTGYDATFNFLAADIDAGATPAAFIVTRYDGAAWNPTNEGGAAATSTSIVTETALGEFAIGEVVGFNVNLGSAGRFDAYDPPPVTPAASVRGNIRTKVAGTAFTVTIVHLTVAGTALANLAANVTIDLVDASPAGGVFTNNCSSLWTTVIATSGSVAFGGGNNRTWTFTVNDSYPNVRVKVTAAGEIGCSGDRFAIRPADLLLEALDGDWQTSGTTRFLHNTGAAGGNVHAASRTAAATPRPFTLRATARTSTAVTTANYTGTPTVRSGPTCVLPAGCATGALDIGAFASAGGVATATANYGEAGTFNLELQDLTFADVDAADTALGQRRIPQSPAAREIGRFVPDRFQFSGANAPQFRTYDAVCAGVRSFTYIGQPFTYAAGALPTATVEAVNAAGAVTTNYRGALFTLTGAGLAETYSQNAIGPAMDDAAKGTPTLTAIGNGTATYTADAAGSIRYTRGTASPIPAANNPFNANLSLSVSATDTSEAAVAGNGNITTATALVFNGGGGGIAFDQGSVFRYGRVRILNALGSEKLDLPLPMRTEYWTGTGFVTNAEDNCTSFVAGNFTLGNYQGSLNAGNMGIGHIVAGGVFASGTGTVTLTAPTGGPTTPGTVDICVDLDLGVGTDPTCQAATPANRNWLQMLRTNPPNTYTQDPVGRGAFGLYGSQPNNFIYFRENF